MEVFSDCPCVPAGGTTYAVYSYMNAHNLPTASAGKDAESPETSCSGCAFDAIARKYDQAVGSEEWAMGTTLLRKWLLNHAKGDVLEISAGGSVQDAQCSLPDPYHNILYPNLLPCLLGMNTGTGRNLPHYSLEKLRSLTLCDLSEPMLQLAEDKFHDLNLGRAGVPARFCLRWGKNQDYLNSNLH